MSDCSSSFTESKEWDVISRVQSANVLFNGFCLLFYRWMQSIISLARYLTKVKVP